jgi:hypothetical protein
VITNCFQAENYEMLYEIHQNNYNIGLLNIEENEPDTQRAYLEASWANIPTNFKCMIDKNNFELEIEQLNELYYVLDDCEEKNKLINFLKFIVSNFADITDAPILGISLEKVTGDLCRFFHYDVNHLRLVYPLLGPGTLWLTDENVRREYLGKGNNDLVVIDQDKIFQVPAKTITLLKGNGHPTANNRAIIHASPVISKTSEKRILLRIESIF